LLIHIAYGLRLAVLNDISPLIKQYILLNILAKIGSAGAASLHSAGLALILLHTAQLSTQRELLLASPS